MPTCLIGLGANLGDRQETLRRAVELLARQRSIRVLQVSRWHETRPACPPRGGAEQPAYLNGAATIETTLAPRAVLTVLHDVETQLGRRREHRWEPRPIDLDLLLYEDHVEQSAPLVVPHPRMAWRRFVLEPAAQIAPSMVHPVIGWSIARLLGHLNTTPPYVAVTGTAGAENACFVRRIAEARTVDVLVDARGFPADSSGRELAAALECLRRRARALSAGDPRWSRRWTVSDFWFDESRAWALSGPATSRPSCILRLWRRLEPRVVRPRLVVWLDVPARRRLRQAIQRQLRRTDVGPVLRIVDPRSSDALDEVIAAIEAME